MINSLHKVGNTYKRILVVEDNKMHSELLKIIIQSSFDAGVVIAENGKEALDKITDDCIFDLIIIDIMIPKINGIDVLKAIRKIYERIPILMLSALNSREAVDKSFAAGADDYATKPIEKSSLKEKIGILLEKNL